MAEPYSVEHCCIMAIFVSLRMWGRPQRSQWHAKEARAMGARMWGQGSCWPPIIRFG